MIKVVFRDCVDMRNDFLYNMDGVPLSVNVVGYTCHRHIDDNVGL